MMGSPNLVGASDHIKISFDIVSISLSVVRVVGEVVYVVEWEL